MSEEAKEAVTEELQPGHLLALAELRANVRLNVYRLMQILPTGREAAAMTAAQMAIGDLLGLVFPTDIQGLGQSLVDSFMNATAGTAQLTEDQRRGELEALSQQLVKEMMRASAGVSQVQRKPNKPRILIPNRRFPAFAR